jgi:hypothetical protein
MSVHVYRDDDDGYRDWLKKYPGGYVINIPRNYSPNEAHLHDASCSTLTAQLDRDVCLTGPYVKVCGQTLAEVERWPTHNGCGPVEPCGFCRGGGGQGGDPPGPRLCPAHRIELSVTGKCPTCDDD